MNTAAWVAVENPYEAEMWETHDGGWRFYLEPGPWEGEPHAARVLTTDVPAIVMRNRFGGWCGYVGVPEGHWAWGKSYGRLDVDVHGGLTYGNWAPVFDHVAGIPGAGLYWLGFDCAHYMDLSPAMIYTMAQLGVREWTMPPAGPEAYRTIDFAVAEVVHLAKQLS